MVKLTIRKAFKASCELKEKISPTRSIFGIQTAYAVNDSLGSLEEVLDKHFKQIEDAQSKAFHGYQVAQVIRNKIAEANTRALSYAENRSINELIAEQNLLKQLILSLPEERNVVVFDKKNFESNVNTTKERLANQQSYSATSNRLNITGITSEMADKFDEHRLNLRADLEKVTGQLAYANITETVELSDKELEILKGYQIPV